ncbi:hypothetical protein RFI_08598 [Reticulomyxa filosa]|uniref:inositol-1,3,4-trisphosphate 5/6-kinase n=1 Tax=Reticulomyxa filosa TaxID=46433 RepID=X6NR91_RETFI|nr:hypothetical protein RFI_08598 [Reticulomyxa filosa]|eukprot:ETO28531.1 hypothetical protein RFI_08598 [Reticulomyxa filosa]
MFSTETSKKHFTYIAGGNLVEIDKLNDRWHVISTIDKAKIVLKLPKSNREVSVVFPNSALITAKQLAAAHKLYKAFGIKAFDLIDQTKEEQTTNGTDNRKVKKEENDKVLEEHEEEQVKKLVRQIQTNMKFPLYAKPRQSGTSHADFNRNKEVAHHLFIIPNIEMLLSEDTLNHDYDWVVQEYVDHKQMCYKIYALGCHVFASINDSTPNVDEISLLSTMSYIYLYHFFPSFYSLNTCSFFYALFVCVLTINNYQVSAHQHDDEKNNDNETSSSKYHFKTTGKGVLLINSKNVSKKQCKDQTTLENWKESFITICKRLRNILQIDMFGVDILFDSKNDQKMFIVDLNYFPSYKSVNNFHSVFWQYILWQYRECIVRGKIE